MNAVEARNMVDAMSRLYLNDQGRTLLGRLQYFAGKDDPNTVKDIKARVEEIGEIKREIDANYDKWVRVPANDAEYNMGGGNEVVYEEDTESSDDFSESDDGLSESDEESADEYPVPMSTQDGGAPKTLYWGPSMALAAITLFMATIG